MDFLCSFADPRIPISNIPSHLLHINSSPHVPEESFEAGDRGQGSKEERPVLGGKGQKGYDVACQRKAEEHKIPHLLDKRLGESLV